MYVTRVVIDGVRGFSRDRTVDLKLSPRERVGAGWTVLAGRNGSGKTTLLRTIALALAGPRRSNQLLTEIDRWISVGSESARVEIEVTADSKYETLPPHLRRQSSRSFWVGVKWSSPRDEDIFDLGIDASIPGELRAEPAFRGPKSQMQKWLSDTIWSELPRGFFYAAYGPFRRLTGAGADAQRLMLAPIPISRIASLFREDASLAESVRWLQEQHFRRLEQRAGAEQLVDGVIDLLNDGLMPDEVRVDHVDSEGLWLEHADRVLPLPLQQLSDGYRTVSSLVTDLIRGLAASYPNFAVGRSAEGYPVVVYPGVVLIDEIDVHLHVSWQQRIGPWLTRHFPNIQFIVTTHSPYICQSATEGGLIRLPGPSESGSPRLVDEQLYRRIIHGTGDDAVTSELFGVDTLYTSSTQDLRKRLSHLEGQKALGLTSPTDENEYEQLRNELTSSPVSRVFELGDGDQ